MHRGRLRDRLLGSGPPIALAVVLGVGFLGTAVSTAWARVAALRTVEPYAFAVQEQLLANFARYGRFFQTIHRGYEDAWTWSGHRSGTFVLAGLLHAFLPGPVGLASLQIALVTLGAVPAAALGRAALGGPWGMALGAALYLGCPAVIALALQDYQDLVLGLPLLLLTLWAMRSPRVWVVALGALAGCLAREETVPLVVAAAAVTFDRGWTWRRWLRNVLVAVAVAGAWAGGLALLFPVTSASHDMPLSATLAMYVDGRQAVTLYGKAYFGDFYALAWAPLGLVGLLAPLTALPGAVLVLLHMTIPFQHGVDRAWSQHAHHMAPAVAFLVAAAIAGSGRLLRWLASPRLGRWGRPLAVAVALGGVAYGVWWDLAWARWFNLVPALLPVRPATWHPAWDLVRALPVDAVPAVPVDVSLAVADRPESYTWAESLLDKAPDRGLGAATHLIAHEDDAEALAWARAMPGAREVARSGPFLLLTWAPGAPDPTLLSWAGDLKRRFSSTTLEVDAPGVAPRNPRPNHGYPVRTGRIGDGR